MIWDQEGCRNRGGTRVFWLDVLTQDVQTLVFLVCLLKMFSLGCDMGSRAMSEPRRNARVLARCAHTGCPNPNVFGMFTQNA